MSTGQVLWRRVKTVPNGRSKAGEAGFKPKTVPVWTLGACRLEISGQWPSFVEGTRSVAKGQVLCRWARLCVDGSGTVAKGQVLWRRVKFCGDSEKRQVLWRT